MQFTLCSLSHVTHYINEEDGDILKQISLLTHQPIQYVKKQYYKVLHGLFNTDDNSSVLICHQGVDWFNGCFYVFVGVRRSEGFNTLKHEKVNLLEVTTQK